MPKGLQLHLSSRFFQDAEQASEAGYNYTAWPTPPTPVSIDEAVVIMDGTVEHNATVDLVMSDEAGNKYVVMITANLLKGMLRAA